MGGWLSGNRHLVRMAGLFLCGVAAFLALRWFMVPAGFGVYGHYRAAALEDVRGRALHHAGRGACAECHADVAEALHGGKHAGVGCEACHGPQAAHVQAGGEKPPSRPDSRTLCPRCHEASAWKPKGFPQFVVAEHAPSGPCVACHKAHAPTMS